MEDIEARRELYQGFGSTLSRAIELVVAPFLFAALGFAADRVFGTSPLLAIVCGVIGAVGGGLRAYYAYVENMKAANRGKPWERTA